LPFKRNLQRYNVVVEVESAAGGGGGARAVWPYLVRLAPGARIVADTKDKVSFAWSSSSSSSSAPLDDEYLLAAPPDGGGAIRKDAEPGSSGKAGKAGKAGKEAAAAGAASKTELTLRATCLELRWGSAR
jgi:hypothetical protein